MDESFINSNFPELDFSQNLKEWKEKEKNGKKGVLTYEEYLKKAKEQRLSSEGKQSFNNTNSNNQAGYLPSDLSRSPNQGSSSSNKFSYEDYKKQKGLNHPSNSGQPSSYSPNANFNANPNNDMDFNKINNNFSFSNNANKFEPLNFNNQPENSGPAEINPYENISLENLNLNSNNRYNQQAINYNNYHNNNMGIQSNYGYGGHSNFPLNSNIPNQGFPQNNVINPYNNNNNNKNNNNINNDFFNINNLDFPK